MNEPLTPRHRYVARCRAAAPRDLLLRWESDPRHPAGAAIVVNTIVSPYFLDVFNLADATFNFSEKAIIALAMALLILVREIDLSVAAIVALAALAIGYAAEAGLGPPVCSLIGLGSRRCSAASSTACWSRYRACPRSSSPSAPCRCSAA